MRADDCRVSRVAHFPQAMPNRLFDAAVLLQFRSQNRDDPGAPYRLSVLCRCLMPDEQAVHANGERIASNQNAGHPERGEGSEKHRRYLGFYDVTYADLSTIRLQDHSLAVYWIPEDGVDAHMEVSIEWLGGDPDAKLRRADRSAAIKTMAARLRGPFINPAPADDLAAECIAELPVQNMAALAG